MTGERRVGPWRLRGLLGQGATAEVWDAVHVDHGASAAVKVLTAARARNERAVRAFEREVRAVAALDHPGVVMLHDVGTGTSSDGVPVGAPWVAMERARGSLRNQARPGTWPDLRGRLQELLAALAHAHAAGVVHRDIKPGNVLVGLDGRLLLADFGMAHAVDENGHGAGGTPAFMSPEQFRADWRAFGPWTDLYALGGLTWALTTGRPPYVGRSLAELHSAHASGLLPPLRPRFAVPGGLLGWLQRLLHPDPRERFQRAADATEALLGLRGDDLPAAEQDSSSEPATFATLSRSDEVAEARRPRSTTRSPSLPRRMPPWPPLDPGPTSARRGSSLGLYGLREAPLVGRRAELERIWAALGDARARRVVRTLLLHGGAGVGKTRLARAAARMAHEVGGAEVIRVLPHREGGGELAELAQQLTRSRGLVGAALHGHLERWLEEHAEGGAFVFRGVLDLLEPRADPRRPAERYHLLRRLIRAVSANQVEGGALRPVVLLVDDAPWTPDALGLVSFLAAQAPDLPVLALLTARTEAIADNPALPKLMDDPAVEVVEVAPLSQEARVDLVRHLLVLDEAVAEQVVARTDGNPLFTVQLVGDWVQRGLLRPGPQGFLLPPHATLHLPDDIHALWRQRVDRFVEGMPAGSRSSLEIAALLGPEVDPGEWRGACRVARVPPDDALVGALLDHRLAEARADRWAFAHGMLRESLARDARDGGRWVAHHDACATALQIRIDVARSAGLAERLGRHLLEAERPQEAVDWLLSGGAERADRSDYHGALELDALTRRALDACRRPPTDPQRGLLAVRRAHVLSALGRHDDAHDLALGTAQAFAAAPSVRAQALRIAGLADAKRGHLDRAEQRLIEAIACADEAMSLADRAGAEAFLAEIHRLRGRPGDARWWGERALSAFDALGLRRGCAEARMGLAAVAVAQGDAQEASRHIDAAEADFEAVGARFGLATVTIARGDLHRKSGQLEPAAVAYARARDLLSELGSADRMFAEFNLALTRLAQARHREAGDALRQAESLAEGSGRMGMLGAIQAASLPLIARDGDEVRFAETLDRSAELLERTRMVDPDLAWVFEQAAEAAAAQGWRSSSARARQLADGQRNP